MIKRILRDILPELPRALVVATIIALIVATLVEGLFVLAFNTDITFSLSQLSKLTVTFDIIFLTFMILVRGALIWYDMNPAGYEQGTGFFNWIGGKFWIILLVILITVGLGLIAALLALLVY